MMRDQCLQFNFNKNSQTGKVTPLLSVQIKAAAQLPQIRPETRWNQYWNYEWAGGGDNYWATNYINTHVMVDI